MAKAYEDFVLDISPDPQFGFVLRVVRSPAGEASLPYQFPYDSSGLDVRLKDLQIALLKSGGQRRKALLPEEATVQEFGATLFDSLFTGDVRLLFEDSRRAAAEANRGLRLRLRIQAPGLAALPWEFLFDTRVDDYVVLATDTPIVRQLPLTSVPEPLSIEPPLRILGLIASPANLRPIDVRAEQSTVERAVAGLVQRGLVELHWVEGQGWRDLRQAIRSEPWHVLHFMGHGGFDATAGEGVFYFADEAGQADTISATDLNRILAGRKELRLLLLNACQGATGDSKDIFSSAAATLVRGGTPAVVAMQFEITDRAATEFARTFYEAIVEGLPVDTAVDEARRAISVAIPNSLEWGIPVLYMRSLDGHIFDMDAGALRTLRRTAAPKEPEPLIQRAPPPQVQTESPAPVPLPLPIPVAGAQDEPALSGPVAEEGRTGQPAAEAGALAGGNAATPPPGTAPLPPRRGARSERTAARDATSRAPAPDPARARRKDWFVISLVLLLLAAAGIWYALDRAGAVRDEDGDGLADAVERSRGLDPAIPDWDWDGLNDGDEVNRTGTDPFNKDSDGDGLLDGEEVLQWGTNPNAADSDGDGVADAAEVQSIAAVGTEPPLEVPTEPATPEPATPEPSPMPEPSPTAQPSATLTPTPTADDPAAVASVTPRLTPRLTPRVTLRGDLADILLEQALPELQQAAPQSQQAMPQSQQAVAPAAVSEAEGLVWNARYAGTELGTLQFPSDDPALCALACEGESACRAWSLYLYTLDSAACTLYADVGPLETAENSISATKAAGGPSWQWNTAYAGTSLGEFIVFEGGAVECAAACGDNQQCAAWTLTKAACLNHEPVCTLFDASWYVLGAEICSVSGEKAGAGPDSGLFD